ncbi:uncharacterized protein LOC107274958 isoform X2 [Cephus cinctus]|uniref:Uncharacterized protein LOC107274958 isoform X2 n=1 Tax=Cephus cinctus TaxID=211228 RepID=A0AAJ7CG52_CEPCN|nr:uncharacterized protein LOC107274958 isoform X2 [Cephus cinctus]
MEKWRSKGKSNVTTDSLLPPTRRFPNTSAIQPDKKKERKWSIGGFLKRISATRDSDSTSSGDNTGHPEKHTTSRHSRTASKAKVKNAPNAKLAYATDKHSPSPGNKKSDNLDKKEPVVIIEGNNDMESQVTRSQDSIHACRDSMHSRSSDGSLDCVSKKLRKEKIKARVEARRDQLCGDSSSDEGLSKSNNSLETFRSDESITNVHRNDSCNRKSRASRTERYIKRLSREDCSNGNNSNCVKSLATELALPHEDATVYHAANEKCRPPMHPRVTSVQTKSQAVTTFPRRSTASVDPFDSTTASNYHPRSFCSETCLTGQSQSSYDPFAKRTLEFCTDFNQNNNYAKEKKPSKMFRDEHRRQTDLGGVVPAVKNYASIQPVGCWQSSRRQLSTPPEPPPRDPQRRVFSFGSSDVSARPSSSSFDNNNRSEGLGKIGNESLSINNKKLSRNDTKNSHQYNSNDEVTWVETNISVRPRPSSVNSTFITTPPWKCNKAGYPINRYHCSDEENSLNSSCNSKSRKQKVENCSESETSSVSRGLIIPNSSPGQIQPIDPNMDRLTLQKDVSPIMDKNVKNTAGDFGKSSLDVTGELSQQYANRKSQSPPNPPIRRSSYVGSLNTTNVTNTADTEMADRKRNSRNLEEALSELEAIYNSLRLGDEDLLERAERRSMEEFARKDPKLGESLTNSSSGASDKSSLDGKSTEDHSSKPEVPDRLKDDMAYRRMNPKERPASLDSQTSLSKISYLFVSPVLSRKELDYNVDARKIQREEPDITRDDVVFRSINHANNMLRIVEPQPPFGIPLGPVTSATDSDYLHSIPIKPEQPRSSYIPKVEPDIVTDDLAFRNLRKDSHKDATTFHDIGEKNDRELINKGSRIGTNSAFGMKKNRAVRSLSANLYGLINKQVNSYNVYDQTRIPTNFQDALNKGNTSFRGKYDFAYDSDASRGQNVRHVMSDTESSEIGSRWFRSIDSDVDVNGNRSKGIFRRKLQVHVPPPKDTNSYDQDSANKLPDSSYGARTASPTFFSSSDKLFIGKTSSLPASSVVSPIRAKQVEPFTELEIAKYKKLCEDLENLVHLAKGGNAVLNTTENFSNNFITKDDKLNDSRANDRMMSNEAKEISENLSNLVDLANNELLTENEKKEKSNKFVQACKSTMDAVSDISSVQKVRENNKDSSTLDTSVPENDNVINGNKNTANNVCIETKTGDTCDKKMNQSEESESSAARKDEFIDKIKVENNNESKSPRTAFDDEKEVKISQSTSDSQGLANDKETVVDSSVLIVPDNEEPVNIVTDSEECDFSSEEHLLFNFEKLSYSSNRDGTSTSTSLEIVNPDDDIENVDDEDDDDDDNQYDDGSHNNDSNFKYHHEKEMRSDSTLDSQGGCEVMVAAGATSLMAAREGNPTNGTESRLVQRENQSTASRYHEAQNCQQNAECNTKKTAVTSSLNSNEHKNGPPQLEKTNNRLASRIESREGSKSPSSSKTTAIRETKASRLRAASIVSPNGSSGATSISRRSGVTESSSPWRLQSNITLRSKQKSPMSSDSSSTPNTIRERDKSYKRKSFLNRSLNAEEVLPDRSINQYDTSGRRGRRMTTSKRNQNTDTLSSSDSTTSRQSPSNPVKRSMESKETTPRRTTNQQDTGRPNDAGRPKNHASPSTAASIASSSSGMKSSSTQRTSTGTKVTLNNESSARVKTTRSRIEQPSQKHLAKDIDMSERSDSTPEPEDVLEQDSEEERNKTTTCKSVDSNNEQSKGNNDGTVIESPSAQGKDDDVDASNAFDAQERNIVQRSNSVSKMASHFKALEEQVKADAEKSVKRRAVQKGSRGIQRYRERKQQGIDRFNTQPITYQEVQEAVLQNQRNTATNNSTSETPGRSEKENDAATTTDDEFDPSKLSLADRVRLFNQKIATESVPLAGGLMPRETSQKRRPANRYKTQPITSEEVEVACRISPLNVNYFHESPLDAFGTHHSSTRSAGSQGLSKSSMSLHPELPKSILKSSGLQTSEVSRPRTPELEGFSLLKSVLKKESEEQHQTVENSDLHPSSILKSDSLSKCDECSSARAGNVSVADKISLKSNATSNSELFKAPSGAEPFLNVNLQEKDLLLSDDTESEDVQYAGTEKSSSLSGFKNPVIQRQLHALGATGEHVADVTDLNLCKNLRSTSKSAKHLQSSTETLHTSDDETSSSGGREIRSIIQNELDYWRHQDAVAGQTKTSPVSALSKSASHHMLSREVTRNTKLMDTATMTTTTTTTEKRLGIPLPGLCRSATQPMPVSESNNVPGTSIAERLAALQRSGTTNWKKRVPCEPDPLLVSKLCDNDSVTDGASSKDDSVIRQGVLADRLGKLESAAEGWRKRVAMPDAVKFSVAGKMKVEQFEGSNSELLSPLVETTRNGCNRKKVPRPERFRSRKGNVKDASSTPSSPSKEATITFQRSFSEPVTDDSGEDSASSNKVAPTVSIPRADDETFTAFFKGVSSEKCESETLELNSSDFDLVTSYSELLVQKRIVRTQRRRLASKNPLRALAARTDLKTEYTEIKTGVAEKVMRSLNIEKLAKSSSFAVEALAGLASTENFSAVTLKTLSGDAIGHANKLCAYKDLMLILVKGRRHVQVRLVEPIAASVNSGDNYILVTKTEIYNYVGKYSNVIERARAVEIAQRIQQTKDLGSQASEIITISEDKPTCSRSHVLNFWNHLGVQDNDVEAIEAGHPDEDELYESAVIDTNMVYEITGEELVPFEKYWGSIPKIEMLDPSKILVFDFGSEMYIWNGKTASMDKRKVATRLTKELWEEGYDYEECAICPINAALTIGRRAKIETLDKKGSERPSWCLFGKLTQHMETILFREKFLDWPDFSRVIRTKDNNVKEQVDGSIVVEPSNIDTMIQPNTTLVDFVLEGTHLGRGTGWYDEELMRHHEISTTNVTVWHVDEFSYTLLSDSSVGQFFSSDSYIVRWMFTITITGRELSGQPSKHSVIGRDRCVYFIWQGKNASLNEQGTAALLTVELDREEGRQVRVVQGFEPAVFLNLFSGRMVVNNGKRMEKRTDSKWRMYICRGTLESETSLVEVPCSARQLRSRGSILLLGATDEELYVWHGSNTLPHIRQNALNAANLLKKNRPEEVGLTADSNINICEINEGEEPKEFFTALGGMKKKLYVSLTNAEVKDHTPRLFHFSSLHGVFTPTELLCAHRAELATPFPFLQEELYQVNQPALFLLDNRDELWVWQGWWPDTGDKDQTGSGAVRWQAERRALMNMAIQYWKITHPEATDCPVYLVWAGLEPLQFTNLFPIWVYHDDVAEINIRDGRKPGEVLSVEAELARLTKSTYPPAQLLQRPLPEGVDPTCLELYLSPQHFKELLGMTKEVFQKLPIWKQLKLKKNIGLF